MRISYWSSDVCSSDLELSSWNPIVGTPSMEGVLHIGHFRFEFTQAWRRIADQLTGQTRERWCLLLAADAVENAEPDDDQVRLLRAANALTKDRKSTRLNSSH